MGQGVVAAPGKGIHVEPVGGLDVLAEAALTAQEATAAEEGDREECLSPAAAAVCDGGATETVERLQGTGQEASRAELHEDGSSDEDSEEVRARRDDMEKTEKTERKAFERARGAERQAEADRVKYLAWRNVSFLFKGWNTLSATMYPPQV